MRVLVTDPHTRTALAAVRSLAKIAEVQVAGDRRRSIAAASRYVRRSHLVPDLHRDGQAFLTAIDHVVRENRIDAILPVTDASCRILLEARARFLPSIVVGPTFEAFAALSDKSRAAALATQLGLDVPEGGLANDVGQADELARKLGYPVVLKPVRSASIDPQGRIRRDPVVRVDQPEDIARAWEATGAGPALVQAFVSGWGEGVFLLRWKGATWAACAHRRLREKPPGGGVSTLRESVAVDPAELRKVEALLDALHFDGVAMAEFRTDGRSRWLMEFNARLWGSVQLAVDSGVDFPKLLVEASLGGAQPALIGATLGCRSRWLLGDIDHALLLARGARDAAGRSGVRAALRALALPTGPHSRLEVFRPTDPAPFLREAADWLVAVAKRR